MNGLHACKPGNEPQVGQVKTFVVINNPANGSKKAWTKIKSANAEQGGTPFKITSVKPTGYTDSYGNISFNLDIEPADGSSSPSRPPPVTPGETRYSGTSGSSGGKEGYWERKEAHDLAREQRDIAKQPRIERQHAQEMALRYCAIAGEKAITTEKLRPLIDWFQRDVGHVPASEGKAGIGASPSEEPDDTEIPF